MAKNTLQLGRPVALPASPDEATLDRVPNPQAGVPYLARFTFPEFTSICPVTGQPDFARITIDYIPGKTCLETKALKFYLASFRNEPAFNEAVINRILDYLIQACRPKILRIEGKFAPRGGLGLAVVAEHPKAGAASSAPKFWRRP